MASGHGVIGIHFVPVDGFHWAEFLQQKLSEDGYNIKSMLLDLTATTHSHFFETNIILVSPEFFSLNKLALLSMIDPRRALMVLLGTDAKDLRSFLLQHKFSDMLNFITFFETEASERCVRELLIGIIKLYEHVHENSDEEGETYDTLPAPRKSLTSQTEHDDIYKVALSCSSKEREVFILCNRKGSDEIQILLKDHNGQIKAIHENKVIYKFAIDRSVSTENLHFTAKDGNVTLGKGQVILPSSAGSNVDFKEKKTQSKLELLQEILGEEDDPICLMCKALNLQENSREALDANLAQKCQCLEPLRKFEGTFFENMDTKTKGHSEDTWPTLLHFAAHFNLPQFCEELLKFPWSMDANSKINKNSETPLEIAKQKEHLVVAKKLEHFIETQNRTGNVPGNKDSGVVEDEDQPGGLRYESSYTDMSQLERDSTVSFGDEDVENLPPPKAHDTKTYVNCNDVPPRCGDNDTPPPPPAHARSLPRMSIDSDTSEDYLEMSGRIAPTIQVTPTEHHHHHESIHRSKSEGQANFSKLELFDDEDYAVPEDLDDIREYDAQSTGSHNSMFSIPLPMHDVQLPTHAHHERQSGFFKKFKIFGKHHKKDKEPKPPKQRGRKMSMPTESDLQAFQKLQAMPRRGRRGSVQHVQPNRDSSSSTSSGEMHPGHHRDNKATPTDLLAVENKRTKKKHFLDKDARKSIRIKTAMTDQINPLPLPRKTGHLLPPEL